ncbi:methylated-DNA--[protein]-cysteine S-methyltransferase [Frankia sp. R82]|uniref:methylated-DNA--[protein]-cysteine S-methyltransferase n=1 Tax=Frankia sp. R82 TaxID=2950553 RepID=UPI0020433A3E|nr:methylated-DNA--[protein]-cysteine S-methyltransferase [Frankia sp. R82]MCM3886769.1 methylated-DNA--[protein]-cysteine S-methyltransferase [Frankia sp. R82]
MTTTRGGPASGSADSRQTTYTTLPSPLGDLLLVGIERPDLPTGFALSGLSCMTGQPRAARPGPTWRRAPEPFRPAATQLAEYFAGQRHTFDLPLWTGGSAFAERVWRALETIPFGTTITYGQLAGRIGAGRSDARAVGTAVGANPLLLVRPCHRVIGADGRLRGFAAGLDRKEFLLRHEGVLGAALDLPIPPPAAPRHVPSASTPSAGTLSVSAS